MNRAEVRYLLLVVVAAALAIGVPAPTSLRAQAPAQERLPSFEVATVKENRSGDTRAPMRTFPGGRFEATNVLLRFLIAEAFMDPEPVHLSSRILGGPGWIGSTERMPDTAPPPGITPIDPNGPSIFTALHEQLGLKLESTKGPVDVLVIDSVDHPTPE